MMRLAHARKVVKSRIIKQVDRTNVPIVVGGIEKRVVAAVVPAAREGGCAEVARKPVPHIPGGNEGQPLYNFEGRVVVVAVHAGKIALVKLPYGLGINLTGAMDTAQGGVQTITTGKKL